MLNVFDERETRTGRINTREESARERQANERVSECVRMKIE